MKKVTKQADIEAQRTLHEIDADLPSKIKLSNGKEVKVGWMRPCTQDKIDDVHTSYFKGKKDVDKSKESELLPYNEQTRKVFAKCCAAILLNNYVKIKLFWWIKWRMLYYWGGWTANDYFQVIIEAKKKAQQELYLLGMALLVEMTGTWTMMTKREAEEYRAELELARKQQ